MAKSATPSPEAAARRTFVALPLAQLLPPITRPAFRQRSPACAQVMTDWPAIVGPRLAAITQPRKLSHGQLTVACAGPVAMELQHSAAALIERINTQTGTAVVARLRFVQAPVTASPPLPMPAGPIQGEAIAGLPPGDLNDALAALKARLQRASR